MRVAFVYAEMETLGIQYISSVLKKEGHAVELFFDPQLFGDTVTVSPALGRVFDFKEKLIEEMKGYAPDVVGFSVLSTHDAWASDFARRIKEKIDVPIIFGGIHPTCVPEEVMRNKYVDYVIVGEGEHAFAELLDSKCDKRYSKHIKNLCYKNNGDFFINPLREPVADLDALPFPDKSLFYEKMPYLRKNYTIMTSRGCPYSCTYCCNGVLNKIYEGKYLRRRSPENVICELEQAKLNYQAQQVFIDDSTFTYDKKWLTSFALEYRKRVQMPFFCWVYPAHVDEELLEILKSMNCRAVEMGVESLDPQVRTGLFHRFYANADVEKAINLFHKYKIFCVVDNIKGFTGDIEGETKKLVEFYNRHRPNKIYLFEHRPFPKTEIRDLIRTGHEESSRGLLPFTIDTPITTRTTKKLELLFVLIYFLPRRVVAFILRHNLYRFFPPLRSYNLLEMFPYLINLMKLKKFRLWYPIRGTRRRYIHYLFTYPRYFMKRLGRLWA